MDRATPAVSALRLAAAALGIAVGAVACSGDDPTLPAPPDDGARPAATRAAKHDHDHDHDDDGAPARPKQPAIFEFVPPMVDLGILEQNDKRQFEFEVFNRSNTPFRMTNVTTGCKCLTLDFDRGEIAPGKSGKVRARVHANFDGIRKTVATVTLSDPAHSTGTIEYRYVLVPELKTKPRKIEFGRIGVGQESEQTVELTLQLPDSIPDPVLEPFLQHELPITLTVDPPTVKPTTPGMRDLVTTLHVKLKSAEVLPPFETSIILHPKEEKSYRTAMIQVTGQVAAAWYFDRTALSFGDVRVGKQVSRNVRFVWPGETAPEVKELKSDLPELALSYEVDAANHCFVITVKYPAEKPATLDGRIAIVTSLSSEPSFLRVTGRAR